MSDHSADVVCSYDVPTSDAEAMFDLDEVVLPLSDDEIFEASERDAERAALYTKTLTAMDAVANTGFILCAVDVEQAKKKIEYLACCTKDRQACLDWISTQLGKGPDGVDAASDESVRLTAWADAPYKIEQWVIAPFKLGPYLRFRGGEGDE